MLLSKQLVRITSVETSDPIHGLFNLGIVLSLLCYFVSIIIIIIFPRFRVSPISLL
jgi:hypothetical protein